MIGLWLLVGFLIIVGICIVGGLLSMIKPKGSVGYIAFFLLSAFIIWAGIAGGNWWLNNTASGIRTQVNWQAEMQIGLHRSIQVFTATGELVYEYVGRFDVEQNNYRIMIDVFNEQNQSRRIYISAPAGVVIISEIMQ